MTIPNLPANSIDAGQMTPHLDLNHGGFTEDHDDLPGLTSMTAYAIAQLRNVRLNDGIVAYLHGIDATLEPFRGRFIIHGGRKEVLEGTPSDDLIIIAFPTIEAARCWYASPAYQALISLRTQGAEGDVFLIQGVDKTHRATDILR
jgi:uncharacterized protein (DUF1330 family)